MIEIEGGSRVFGLREGKPFSRGALSIWRHIGKETGSESISLSVLEFSPGRSPWWRHESCHEVLFVLAGEGSVFLDGEPNPIAPDTGVDVRPGVRVRLETRGATPLLVVSSCCPDPGGLPVFDDSGGPLRRDPVRRGPPPVVPFAGQPIEHAADGRWFRVLVGPESGSPDVTQFVGFIPPGRAPAHFHEYEEVVCILEGRGRFWSGETSTPVGSGSCLFLPRRQPHCLENLGDTPLKLQGVFYPAGSPAVRFQSESAASN